MTKSVKSVLKMRYAIFSDIHSNLEALEVVLSKFEGENIDEYICCGDIVGYGPEPNECIDRVKSIKNIKIVAGNHDRAAVGLFDINWFNDNAKAAILWTSSVLTEENKKILTDLPEKIEEQTFTPLEKLSLTGFTAVHGSPRKPINEYLIKSTDMYENLSFFTTQMCFIGHSHHPFIYTAESGITELGAGKPIQINSKSIINVGSVGQPRDGDNRAGFLILEDTRIKFFHSEYDIKAVQEKMKKQNLPEALIARLSYGK